MAKYIGPKCKLARRERSSEKNSGFDDLSLKSGVRSSESKCRTDSFPGQHGKNSPRTSSFGKQLRAKQKLRRIYGVLEKQFRGYFEKSSQKKGSTIDNLICFLESRLDNLVYRLGFASTRAEARQIVNHGAILVNAKRVNIPSYQIKPGDVVEVSEKSRAQIRIQAAMELSSQREEIDWIQMNASEFKGSMIRLPNLSDLPPTYDVNSVIELYSK